MTNYDIFGPDDGLCDCQECAYRCRNFVSLQYPYCNPCEKGEHRKAKPKKKMTLVSNCTESKN